jgi:hypothetical protein
VRKLGLERLFTLVEAGHLRIRSPKISGTEIGNPPPPRNGAAMVSDFLTRRSVGKSPPDCHPELVSGSRPPLA